MRQGGRGRKQTGDMRVATRLLSLIVTTLLLVFAAFCVWQAWVIVHRSGDRTRVVAAQHALVGQLGAEIHAARQHIDHALADPATHASLVAATPEGRAQAAKRVRVVLPTLQDAEFFSPQLTAVINANFAKFGYAKAAQLLYLAGGHKRQPVTVISPGGQTELALAQVVAGSDGAPLAYAWLTWPPGVLVRTVLKADAAHGGLVLRSSHGDVPIVLASHGRHVDGTSSSLPLVTVAGSTLEVAAFLPQAPLILPPSLTLAVVLAVLALLAAGVLLTVRVRRRHHVVVEEPIVPVKPSPQVAASEKKKPATAPVPAPAPAAAPPPAAKAEAGVEVDPNIFRAYDIRGVVGSQLTGPVAHALGQAIGELMHERGLAEIAVGRDGRLSGPQLTQALEDGLCDAGIDVIDLGMVPTPVVYFACHHLSTGSGVAVTGSHNPPDQNGFKIVVGGETLSEAAITDLGARMRKGCTKAAQRGSRRELDILDDYVERIAGDVQTERRLKVVVDAGNGITGGVGPRLLEAVGCDVVPLFCEVDGHFPNHHPDPSNPANMRDLAAAVKTHKADLGVAFDGDGDRLGVVTPAGEVVFPDRVLMLFARDVLSRVPGATVIYDVKCTAHLGPEILKAGGSPLMWRTGHSLIKAKMLETEAQLAGEMSGHFFFRERWYGFDDGMYAATRLLEIVACDPDGRTPDEIFATLPKGVATPELKIPMQEGENHDFIKRFQHQASFSGARLTLIDGVRADWPDGWGLVRASNTTPVLVLRFDADNAPALARVQGEFRSELLKFAPKLKLPF